MPVTTPLRRVPDLAEVPAENLGIGDMQVIALLTSALSVAALLHYYRWGQILLSGDAVAHINIARRVFDSRTPGPLQLGTVWLPLQHILTIPFIISDWGWSSGIGGAIPSMAAYVLGALGMYRLVRGGLEAIGATSGMARVAAWLAVAVFAANPNLIYLQTTALNEPISLALLVWSVVFFTEFTQFALHGHAEHARRSLLWCGWVLLCDMLVRYDGWFAACAFIAAALLVIVTAQTTVSHVGPGAPAHGKNITLVGPGAPAHGKNITLVGPGAPAGAEVDLPEIAAAAGALARGDTNAARELRRAFLHFVLIAAITPAVWFAYNAALWGNPLEFATGPYSAKAIAQRSRRPGDPHYPGWHSPYVAAQYFLRNATLTMGETSAQPRSPSGFWEKPWLPLAAAATVLVMAAARGLLPWLLLWIPLPFYALAISWGSVPIFIPQWWPFGYVNTRYGLQLLPALAAFFAIAVYFLMSLRRQLWWRIAVMLAACALVAGSYVSVSRQAPICLREIRANGGARYALDAQLGTLLGRLPQSSTLLMYLGEHSGALQRSQIPLRRTINEGNRKLWRAALRAPATSADFVIAGAGDPVAQAVAAHPEHLQALAVVESFGQPPVTIYAVVK